MTETLAGLPVKRVHHFAHKNKADVTSIFSSEQTKQTETGKKKGCYIATCVYGSYACLPVWTLRRFRDDLLSKKWYGRFFIKIYYLCSPMLVKLLGEKKIFRTFWRKCLDALIEKLQKCGVENTPYTDL